jgi:hypothetical protein
MVNGMLAPISRNAYVLQSAYQQCVPQVMQPRVITNNEQQQASKVSVHSGFANKSRGCSKLLQIPRNDIAGCSENLLQNGFWDSIWDRFQNSFL